MRKLRIVLLILILISTIGLVFPTISQARRVIDSYYTNDTGGTAGITIDPAVYAPNYLHEDDVGEFATIAGKLIGIVQIVGMIVSVGALMVIGIRYVVSSVEEKAEYKERLVPYVVGAVLLFGAVNIVNILFEMFHKT